MVRRILHYVGKMDIGGMEAMIMNLYRNIDRTKWQFDFAVHSDKRGCYEDEIERMGGHIYRFPLMRGNPIKYRYKWEKFWNEHKDEYEVFQMHTNSLANIIALQTATKAGVPKRIVHAHSAYANKGKLQILGNILHKYHRYTLYKYSNLYFACSELAANWMFGKDSFKKGQVILINNGIDYCRFSFNIELRDLIRKDLELENKVVLVQVGNFLPVKNHKFTVQLIKQFIEQGQNNIVCLFLGDGPLREVVEDSICNENLEKYVRFLGAKLNIEDYLSASDIFLLPSLYEGMPLSVVEAQVSGLKCLISNTITTMAKISNNVEYLSIENIKDWVDCINNINLNYTRSELLLDSRMNIKNTVRIYTNYISEYDE